MARAYAGTLGPLAFCIILARGLLDGRGADGTIQLALICLFGFAAVGYVVGRIASTTVIDSVTSKMNAELDAQRDAELAQE